MSPKTNIKLIARNKKAWHEYEILEKFEAGMVLVGTEVKALREGRAHLKDAFADLRRGELYLLKLSIGHYSAGNINNHEEERPRKLLMHRWEIKKLTVKIAEKGLTLVPLSMYFKNSIVKVELGLAKGKHSYDKRRDIMERDKKREMEREMKERGKPGR